ncbi:MAG: tRNA (guanosine(37)-N1)-methyltransferase TrmD [Chlamydiae bacterium RIFCSPHIGHO2_12_FULL_49_9]|nr:MAG: tRNA (guanosine(37)-N1)-methyltransferase TrmD [Chlamydiae bacterium RIFCSPHIGHO2_12_FULL_49_9]
MEIDILSLFPDYFRGPFDVSMLKRARDAGLLEIRHTDIREFSENKHGRVDERPFGGGPGMVLCPGPVVRAIRSVRKPNTHVVYLSPQGNLLTAAKCGELAKYEHLVILCGHYEGVDERAMSEIDEEISIGDYVLTSGCAAAIVLIEGAARFIPGVIGHPDAVQEDSFQNGIFDGPHYTRPEVFEGMEVPAVLREGNHAKIRQWRKSEALKKTNRVRPELVMNQGENQ